MSEARALLSGPSSEPVRVIVDASPRSSQSLRHWPAGSGGATLTTSTSTSASVGHGFVFSEPGADD